MFGRRAGLRAAEFAALSKRKGIDRGEVAAEAGRLEKFLIPAPGSLRLRALEMSLAEHVPEIHHSDQGILYAASEYVKVLTNYHVQISIAVVGEPEENGYAERLRRTIKEEEVDLSDYRDVVDAQNQIGRFLMDMYHRKRIHSSLG